MPDSDRYKGVFLIRVSTPKIALQSHIVQTTLSAFFAMFQCIRSRFVPTLLNALIWDQLAISRGPDAYGIKLTSHSVENPKVCNMEREDENFLQILLSKNVNLYAEQYWLPTAVYTG